MKKLSKGKIAVITTTALAVATTAIITPIVLLAKTMQPTLNKVRKTQLKK